MSFQELLRVSVYKVLVLRFSRDVVVDLELPTLWNLSLWVFRDVEWSLRLCWINLNLLWRDRSLLFGGHCSFLFDSHVSLWRVHEEVLVLFDELRAFDWLELSFSWRDNYQIILLSFLIHDRDKITFLLFNFTKWILLILTRLRLLAYRGLRLKRRNFHSSLRLKRRNFHSSLEHFKVAIHVVKYRA